MYKNPKTVHKGRLFDVLSIEADHPNGGVMQREVVDHRGAVFIVPMLDHQTVILIRNRREVVEQTLWEIPAGTLEEGESPIFCAGRELVEETGYEAKQITPLLDFYTSPGFCNEKLYGFVAKDLTYIGQNLDETEEIEVVPVAFAKALEMIKNQEIVDAKTIAALLYKFQQDTLGSR